MSLAIQILKVRPISNVVGAVVARMADSKMTFLGEIHAKHYTVIQHIRAAQLRRNTMMWIPCPLSPNPAIV